jgi:flagellar motor switch protein FliG
MSEQMKRIQEMIQALGSKGKSPGGLAALVGMLSRMDKRTESQIVEALEKQDPELAKQLQMHYFRFEDIAGMHDAIIKKGLSQIHRSTLTLAMKGANEAVKQRIFKNLSRNALDDLQYDMQAMGAKPRSMVEEAQLEVTAVFRSMKDLIP